MTAWALFGIVVGALAAVFVVRWALRGTSPRTKHHARNPRILRLGPSFFFWLELAYLAVLLVLAVLYDRDALGLKTTFEGGLVGEMLPIGVPWFGAVGAVVISLQGVFDHSVDWDRRYNHWHLARPLFGAVLGVMAFYIFVLLLKSTGTELEFLKANAEPDDFIVYYVVAFLVGYREETFRELVKRAVDLVFQPGGLISPAAPAVKFVAGGSEKSAIDFGETTAGETALQTVTIHNVGAAPLTTPTAAVRNEPPERSEFASQTDAITGAGDIAPGTSRTIDIAFAPKEEGDFLGLLELSSPSLTAPASIELSGKGKAESPA